MIKKFISLEWKQFFRSSYWQKSIALNIFLGLLALYFIAVFLMLGIAIYPLLKKSLPDKDPLVVVNSFLILYFLGDLLIRYFLQKLPTMQVNPLLVLPISKKKITNYILLKSIASFFNFLPLFVYLPFSIMLLINGYNTFSVIAWFISVYAISLSNNYLVFLINKNNKIFAIIAFLLISIYTMIYFDLFPVGIYVGKGLDFIVANPLFFIIPLLILMGLYYANYRLIYKNLYLDDILQKKKTTVNAANLSWTENFGDTAVFLKNDIRLIWRNKRSKMAFLMSFIMLPYGLIFFTNPTYQEKMPIIFVFVAIFTTGIFILNFGQFIPAWDSAYYKLLMSQNVRYRKYLESKWILMIAMTSVLFLLTIPYVYFGVDKLLLFSMSLIFNIGFTSLFVLYMGAYNRKRIYLDRSAFMNYQGTGAQQFLLAFGILLVPMLIFYVINKFFSFNIAIGTMMFIGVVGIIFKNYFMHKIEKTYIKNKHKTIHAFNQKN